MKHLKNDLWLIIQKHISLLLVENLHPILKKHKEDEKVRVGKIANGIKNLKLIPDYE
jgi:hypothetical protein